MVAIGLLGDEADRYQLATTRWNPTPSATGVSVQMQAKLRQGNAEVLVGTRVPGNPLKSTSIVGSERGSRRSR
jgi:hypothetical protein